MAALQGRHGEGAVAGGADVENEGDSGALSRMRRHGLEPGVAAEDGARSSAFRGRGKLCARSKRGDGGGG